jgi:hypothetical protein
MSIRTTGIRTVKGRKSNRKPEEIGSASRFDHIHHSQDTPLFVISFVVVDLKTAFQPWLI